ncbi:hypothetical protein CBR_g20119 [Chara braunii]|uniref:Structure-specific endonuclease subunit SLX1 homolog n=1 Tax=Chara braunii TaxID=69332 RepID=A0A388KZP4_CHABU|nr:hypothetical protein CBR_g20119 [Chara braunii]|eukprot:GBG75488.1 hypothetical protein CBR_g20119 [Chara braunii]
MAGNRLEERPVGGGGAGAIHSSQRGVGGDSMDGRSQIEGSCSESATKEVFFACYLLCSINPRSRGRTYIGFTVNPRRRIRQHNGLIVHGARHTRKLRPWEMVLVVHGFPDQVQALQFEWAWQNPKRSLAVREAANALNPSNGVKGRIQLLFTMLTLDKWKNLPMRVQFLSSKYSAHRAVCPPLPAQMIVTVAPMDELPCYADMTSDTDLDNAGDEDYDTQLDSDGPCWGLSDDEGSDLDRSAAVQAGAARSGQEHLLNRAVHNVSARPHGRNSGDSVARAHVHKESTQLCPPAVDPTQVEHRSRLAIGADSIMDTRSAPTAAVRTATATLTATAASGTATATLLSATAATGAATATTSGTRTAAATLAATAATRTVTAATRTVSAATRTVTAATRTVTAASRTATAPAPASAAVAATAAASAPASAPASATAAAAVQQRRGKSRAEKGRLDTYGYRVVKGVSLQAGNGSRQKQKDCQRGDLSRGSGDLSGGQPMIQGKKAGEVNGSSAAGSVLSSEKLGMESHLGRKQSKPAKKAADAGSSKPGSISQLSQSLRRSFEEQPQSGISLLSQLSSFGDPPIPQAFSPCSEYHCSPEGKDKHSPSGTHAMVWDLSEDCPLHSSVDYDIESGNKRSKQANLGASMRASDDLSEADAFLRNFSKEHQKFARSSQSQRSPPVGDSPVSQTSVPCRLNSRSPVERLKSVPATRGSVWDFPGDPSLRSSDLSDPEESDSGQRGNRTLSDGSEAGQFFRRTSREQQPKKRSSLSQLPTFEDPVVCQGAAPCGEWSQNSGRNVCSQSAAKGDILDLSDESDEDGKRRKSLHSSPWGQGDFERTVTHETLSPKQQGCNEQNQISSSGSKVPSPTSKSLSIANDEGLPNRDGMEFDTTDALRQRAAASVPPSAPGLRHALAADTAATTAKTAAAAAADTAATTAKTTAAAATDTAATTAKTAAAVVDLSTPSPGESRRRRSSSLLGVFRSEEPIEFPLNSVRGEAEENSFIHGPMPADSQELSCNNNLTAAHDQVRRGKPFLLSSAEKSIAAEQAARWLHLSQGECEDLDEFDCDSPGLFTSAREREVLLSAASHSESHTSLRGTWPRAGPSSLFTRKNPALPQVIELSP